MRMVMKQRIIIENLEFDTIIGIYDWEQAIHQPLTVNVVLECDMTPAFFSGSIDDTLNYKAICDDIQNICHNEKAKLLETLAYRIIVHLFNNYPCNHIELSLKKPNAIKEAQGVGVTIELNRQEFETLIIQNND